MPGCWDICDCHLQLRTANVQHQGCLRPDVNLRRRRQPLPQLIHRLRITVADAACQCLHKVCPCMLDLQSGGMMLLQHVRLLQGTSHPASDQRGAVSRCQGAEQPCNAWHLCKGGSPRHAGPQVNVQLIECGRGRGCHLRTNRPQHSASMQSWVAGGHCAATDRCAASADGFHSMHEPATRTSGGQILRVCGGGEWTGVSISGESTPAVCSIQVQFAGGRAVAGQAGCDLGSRVSR
jgi:hypothetical protein